MHSNTLTSFSLLTAKMQFIKNATMIANYMIIFKSL